MRESRTPLSVNQYPLIEKREDAVAFDRLIRTGHGLKGIDSPAAYVHRSIVPLEEVQLLSAEELGQLSAFDDRSSPSEAETLGAGLLMECEGYCGT